MKQGKMTVRFYEHKEVHQRHLKKRPRKTKVTTECVIYIESFTESGVLIGTNTFHGYSHCGHKDKYNQFDGKLRSLKRAIALMGSNGVFIPPERITKLLSTFSDKIKVTK